MLKVRAVGHRVIVKADPVEEVSQGGIVLAVDKKREEAAAQKGTVVEVGPMAWKSTLYGYGLEGWEPWVKPGDRIFFARYAGKLIRDMNNGVETVFFVINDDDVQCQILDESVEYGDDDGK
jgi:co-chaperonin GroES (HSP10)